MHNSPLMDVIESVSNISSEKRGGDGIEWAGLEAIVQVLAVDVLHHEKGAVDSRLAIVGHRVEQRDEARVAQAREEGDFFLLAPDIPCVGELGSEQLDRHSAPESLIYCPVDRRHAATPDEFVESIAVGK
jgi:hypothetical protein